MRVTDVACFPASLDEDEDEVDHDDVFNDGYGMAYGPWPLKSKRLLVRRRVELVQIQSTGWGWWFVSGLG